MLRQKAKEEFGRGSSRRMIIDKERAITGATNPMESKYGGCLLKGNSQETRLLSSELNKLDNQLRRQRMHIDQEKKQFLARHALPDPILIVERPPSPEMLRKQLYSAEGESLDENSEPGYMRPTQARPRTPSTIPTIDAFTVKTRKKKNVWEDAYLSSQRPRFQSSVMPSWPLTEEDQLELARGWDLHVKPPRSSDALARSLEYSAGLLSCRNNPKNKKRRAARETQSRLDDISGAFITELPRMRYSTEHLGMERPTKNVSFADEVGLYFNAKEEIESKRKTKSSPKVRNNTAKGEVVKNDNKIPTSEEAESTVDKPLAETTNTTTKNSSRSRVPSRGLGKTRERSDSGKKKPISPFRTSVKRGTQIMAENNRPLKSTTVNAADGTPETRTQSASAANKTKRRGSASLKRV